MFCSGEIPRLSDFNIQPGKSDQLVRCIKAVNIANFADDDSTKRIANARNGGNDPIDVFEQLVNLLVQFLNLYLCRLQSPQLSSNAIRNRAGCRMATTFSSDKFVSEH